MLRERAADHPAEPAVEDSVILAPEKIFYSSVQRASHTYLRKLPCVLLGIAACMGACWAAELVYVSEDLLARAGAHMVHTLLRPQYCHR